MGTSAADVALGFLTKRQMLTRQEMRLSAIIEVLIGSWLMSTVSLW